VHEVNILDELPLEVGAIYVMDRGYLDFVRLARFTQAGAFFVIRGKSNLKFYVVESRPVDTSSGLRCDQTIRLRGFYSKKGYPQSLRRIRFYDVEQSRSLVFLTNHFGLTALQVCEVYRARWQIELFFKWIKGHLRIRSFVGTTENAVRIQIWTALSTYLLVAILKKTLKLEPSLHEILQVLSVTPFEKIPVPELFAGPAEGFYTRDDQVDIPNSLF
jgi:IS4 transposase